MLLASSVLVVFLGAALGSFANVLIVRMHEGTSIRWRSRCPWCRKPIRAKHLVPLVSWFVLRGYCADCGRRIHWQYPAVEAVGAIFALVAFLRVVEFTSPLAVEQFLFELILSFVLLVIVVFDLRWQLVPLEFTAVSAIILGAGRVLLGYDWLDVILGVVVVSAALGFIVVFSRGAWMGIGDPVVGLIMGAALGFPLAIVGFFLSFIIGGSVAAVLLLQGVVTRKTPVPFVPFMAAGTLVTLWYAEPMGRFIKYVL